MPDLSNTGEEYARQSNRAEVSATDGSLRCDHICLKDDDHVERGEPHFYGYENPSPRARLAEAESALADYLKPWPYNDEQSTWEAWARLRAALGKPLTGNVLGREV